MEQIEQVTNDKHSRKAFCRIVRNVDERLVYRALSATKGALDCQNVWRPGAYFRSRNQGNLWILVQAGAKGTEHRVPTDRTKGYQMW